MLRSWFKYKTISEVHVTMTQRETCEACRAYWGTQAKLESSNWYYRSQEDSDCDYHLQPDMKGTAKVLFPYLLVCCHLDMHEWMGIILHAVKAEPSSGNHRMEPKAHYKNANLPYTNYKDNLRVWQSTVVASVIDWAGSLDNLWAVGAQQILMLLLRSGGLCLFLLS
ncbi:hypothetical protein L208DRAFT_1380573 [Tricholoma matsutake]|nr:hypothetical protein L208DRAFT_1380573 [Tricholoma matsutake 945]